MTVERISPQEAHARMGEQGYRYVDVRSVPEFELGHPAGAYNVPWQHQTSDGMRDNGDFMRVMRRAFSPSTPIILGCRTGHRSLLAARRLMDAGYTHVVEMRGGFAGAKDPFGRTSDPGWQQAALPVAHVPEAGRSYSELSDDDATPGE